MQIAVIYSWSAGSKVASFFCTYVKFGGLSVMCSDMEIPWSPKARTSWPVCLPALCPLVGSCDVKNVPQNDQQKSEWSRKSVANCTSHATHRSGREMSFHRTAIGCRNIWFKFICLLYTRFSSRVLSIGLQKALNKYLLNECNRN